MSDDKEEEEQTTASPPPASVVVGEEHRLRVQELIKLASHLEQQGTVNDRGCFVAQVRGPSGAGKSTVSRLFAAITRSCQRSCTTNEVLERQSVS